MNSTGQSKASSRSHPLGKSQNNMAVSENGGPGGVPAIEIHGEHDNQTQSGINRSAVLGYVALENQNIDVTQRRELRAYSSSSQGANLFD